MAESNYDILKIQSGASKKDIRRLIEVWFSSFIQTGVVTMSSSKEFSEHMRIYGLVKNT